MRIKKYQNPAGILPVKLLTDEGQPFSEKAVSEKNDKKYKEKLSKELEEIVKYNKENGTNFHSIEQVNQHIEEKKKNELYSRLINDPDSTPTFNYAEKEYIRTGDKDQFDQNMQIAKNTGLASIGTAATIAGIPTVGVLGTAAGIAGGYAGNYLGDKAGAYLDNKLGTTWIQPTLGITGGLIGGGIATGGALRGIGYAGTRGVNLGLGMSDDVYKTLTLNSVGRQFSNTINKTVLPTENLSTNTISLQPQIVASRNVARIAPSDGRINNLTTYNYKHNPNQQLHVSADTEPGYYTVHFKTNRGSLTGDDVQGLIDQSYADLPTGSRIATWGEVSKGGFSGLNRYRAAGAVDSGEYRLLSVKPGTNIDEIANKYGVEIIDGKVKWPILTKSYDTPPVDYYLSYIADNNYVDTSNPKSIAAIQRAWEQRYPNTGVKWTTPVERMVGFDDVLKIGEVPMHRQGIAAATMMKSRLNRFTPDPSVQIKVEGRPIYGTISDGIDEATKLNTNLYLDLSDDMKHIQGLHYTGDGSWLKVNPYRKKPFFSSQLHEGIGHTTEKFILPMKNNANPNVTVEEIYKRISDPSNLDDSVASFVKANFNKDSLKPREARAALWEINTKLNNDLAKQNGVSIGAQATRPEKFVQYVDNVVRTPDDMITLFKSFDNRYLSDYAKLLEHLKSNPEKLNIYFNNIKKAMKYAPALGIPVALNEPQNDKN